MTHAAGYERCREAGCCLDAISDGYCYSHAYDALGREMNHAFMVTIVFGYAVAAVGLIVMAVDKWVI